jgi:hypothetical protein
MPRDKDYMEGLTKMVRIEIDLPDDLRDDLQTVAGALGIPTLSEAALIALADWTARRKAEIDDKNPGQRYFVNEALDELIGKQSKK